MVLAVSTPQIGFLFSNGNFHRIPAFNGGTYSLPAGINNGGTVVGTSDVFGGGPTRAFLFTDGNLIDLNNIVDPSLPLLTSAAGINDKGQIVATGLNGQSYVLTPKGAGLFRGPIVRTRLTERGIDREVSRPDKSPGSSAEEVWQRSRWLGLEIGP